jgi:hypothetical protein
MRSALAVVLVLFTACGSGDSRVIADSARPLVVVRPPAVPMDSSSLTPGYGLPHPGSWDSTSEYADSVFTIRYPSSATAEEKPPRDGGREVWLSGLPECRWPCYVSVHLERDSSAASLDAAVREQTTTDTADDADAADYVASVRDSLPLGNVRAVHLATYCGDCTSGELLTSRGPWLARIEYNLDDRDGANQILLSHLLAIARTFRWRE